MSMSSCVCEPVETAQSLGDDAHVVATRPKWARGHRLHNECVVFCVDGLRIKNIRHHGQHFRHSVRLRSNVAGSLLQAQRTSIDKSFALRPDSMSTGLMEQHPSFVAATATTDCCCRRVRRGGGGWHVVWSFHLVQITSFCGTCVSRHEHSNAHALAQVPTKQCHRLFTTRTHGVSE